MIRYRLSLERQFKVRQYELLILPFLGLQTVRFEIIKYADLAAENYLKLPGLTELKRWDIEIERTALCILASTENQPEGIIRSAAITAYAGLLRSQQQLSNLTTIKEGNQ